jgi:hypothetical protein
MQLSKDQWSTLISAAIAFLVAILSLFGYNVLVIQPQLAQLALLATACP